MVEIGRWGPKMAFHAVAVRWAVSEMSEEKVGEVVSTLLCEYYDMSIRMV